MQPQGIYYLSMSLPPYTAHLPCRFELGLFANISRVTFSSVTGSKVAGVVSDPESNDIRPFEFGRIGSAEEPGLDVVLKVDRMWQLIN